MDRNDVTAVIPTVGRPSLRAAVASVLTQRGVSCSVLVVVDGAEGSRSEGLVRRQLVGVDEARVLFTGGERGAGWARSQGTDAVSTEWVAYLDDDDEWFPDKSLTQLNLAASTNGEPLISSQVVSEFSNRSVTVPRHPYRDGSIADYLFLRRRLATDRNLLQTSTLLCRAEAAQRVGWRSDLRRHQDWDFVLRFSRLSEATIHQIAKPLVRVAAGSLDSVSGSRDWQASLEWARENQVWWKEPTYVDFVVGQPLRYALMARERDGVVACLSAVRGLRRPSIQSIVLALSGLVPRRHQLATAHAISRAIRGRR